MPPVPSVGTGLSPLDDELGLLPGGLTPRLQASLVRLGSWMPFEHAARELGWLTRASVSRPVAERLTEAAGAAYVAEQTAAVETLERRPTPEPAGPAIQQVSVDGAMISLVGKQWVEVKTLAIGTVMRTTTGAVRARDLSYFSHAVEYLTRASHEAHGAGTAATSDWIGQQAHARKHDAPLRPSRPCEHCQPGSSATPRWAIWSRGCRNSTTWRSEQPAIPSGAASSKGPTWSWSSSA